MARPNPLADPEFAQKVAEAVASGATHAEMCAMFGVRDRNTIARWKKDPRVKRLAFKLIEDRVLQITRKVDAKIEQIIASEDLEIRDWLAIRKEFLAGALRAQVEKADEETIGEAQDFMESNPELARQLLDALEGNVE